MSKKKVFLNRNWCISKIIIKKLIIIIFKHSNKKKSIHIVIKWFIFARVCDEF